ncbi:MAG: phosphoadenylyl-sulfate reductase [Actinobacteria bacterium]|nr:phosphoadenylyl-sulfate reductase [Actinomycetota bacterium]
MSGVHPSLRRPHRQTRGEEVSIDTLAPVARSADPGELAAQGAATIGHLHRAGVDHVHVATAAIRWAARNFRSLVLMSSMGDEVLVHLAARAAPGIEVAFIDTGYHFPETLGTAAAYAATQPLSLLTVSPLQSVAEQDADYGSRLHDRDPDRCCALRKVEPLERTLAGKDAWITGMRRVDAPTRSDIDVVTLDTKRSMVKINPMATWTEAQTEAYARDHDVLLNPLRKSGYTSIGCAPCTRPTAPGDDPRAGRWAGKGKTECGLHV